MADLRTEPEDLTALQADSAKPIRMGSLSRYLQKTKSEKSELDRTGHVAGRLFAARPRPKVKIGFHSGQIHDARMLLPVFVSIALIYDRALPMPERAYHVRRKRLARRRN